MADSKADKTVQVQLVHPAMDARGISGADFKVAGLDGVHQHTFYKNKPTAVTPEVAKVLLESPHFADEFAEVKAEQGNAKVEPPA